MEEVVRKQNIFFQWIFWHFFDMPRNILVTWRGFLRFYLDYFSIHLLIKTFFSHWRKYKWSYGRGFDFGRYFEAFISNLISRTLGAFLRSFLILTGILAEIFIIFVGAMVFLLWIILPALLIGGLIFGLRVVF